MGHFRTIKSLFKPQNWAPQVFKTLTDSIHCLPINQKVWISTVNTNQCFITGVKLTYAHRFIVCALLGALSFQLVFSGQRHQHQCSLMLHVCLITDQQGDGYHSQAAVATFRSPCSILPNNCWKRLSLVDAWGTAHTSERIRFQSWLSSVITFFSARPLLTKISGFPSWFSNTGRPPSHQLPPVWTALHLTSEKPPGLTERTLRELKGQRALSPLW